jgi:hypothetical protein
VTGNDIPEDPLAGAVEDAGVSGGRLADGTAGSWGFSVSDVAPTGMDAPAASPYGQGLGPPTIDDRSLEVMREGIGVVHLPRTPLLLVRT